MNESKLAPRYQDFVIKDGKLIGDFEGLYNNFDDPWHQSRNDHLNDSRRSIALNWATRIRKEFGSTRIIELGCGFGHLTKALCDQGFSSVGIDISQNAIDKARIANPSSVYFQCELKNFNLLEKFDPDIFLMAEITWYILNDLEQFLINLSKYKDKRNRPTFLIHLLTTYAPGIQKYGADKFTDLDGILSYFKLDYLESGFIRTPHTDDPLSQGTYFIAHI